MARQKRRSSTNSKGGRKEEIVKAAARLFREYGFNGISIVDIANAVGLPKGGIYNYIDSKEQLLYEIITRGIRQFLPILREIRNSKDDLQVKLQRAVFTNVRMLATYHDFVSVFLQDKKALSKRHYKEYVGYRDEVEQIFKETLTKGMKEGIFRKTNVDLLTFALLGMCNWVTQWYRSDGKLTAEEIATFYAEAAEHLMRP